jgi:hypothetical protein
MDQIAENGQEAQDLQEQPALNNEPVAKAPEKMLPQSMVDKLIHARTKDVSAKAYEKGMRDAMEQLQAQQQPAMQPQQAAQPTSMGGMQQLSPDQITQMINEVADRKVQDKHQELLQSHMQQQREADAMRVANEFVGKMQAGHEKYPDFAQTVGKLELAKLSDIVRLANGAENTADVMYELAKNPHKIVTLQALIDHPGLQHLAHSEMQRLSDSIKTNEQASKAPSANEPLSRIQPSSVGTDNGERTVKDYRKQPWLRA